VLSLLPSDSASASTRRLFATARISRLGSRLSKLDPTILSIALSALERALNAGNEIKVPVEGGGGG
jgi:hypothetical protein